MALPELDETMPKLDDLTPLAFFTALHRGFHARLATRPEGLDPIAGLVEEAVAAFERNAESACDSSAVACRGGCASCCTIRVAATAPEILLIARTIRALPPVLLADLKERIGAADAATRRLDETRRMALGFVCPFIEHDLCVIYPVRPLACRGHASYDKEACIDALAGRACEVPVSARHIEVRSLVQNAMQSALRDSGLAWGTYELNEALLTALGDEACEARWAAGEDLFAAALITDVSLEEMGQAFDAIKAMGA